MTRLLTIIVLTTLFVQGQVQAQEVIRCRVTAAAGDNFYIDKGRRDGLNIGTILNVEAPTGTLTARVTALASSSARCSVVGESPLPPVGASAQATLSKKSTEPTSSLSGTWTRSDGVIFEARDDGDSVFLQRRLGRESSLAFYRVRLRRTGAALEGRALFRLADESRNIPVKWKLKLTRKNQLEGSVESWEIRNGREVREPTRVRFIVKPGAPAAYRERPAPRWKSEAEWNEGTPLLAAARQRRAEERPLQLRGRAFVQGTQTSSRSPDSTYTLIRSGGELRIKNPFSAGGRLQISAELFRRTTQLQDESDETVDGYVLRRLSYAYGGDRDHSLRLELGRFQQNFIPEFGLLDGTELSRRTPSGLVVGASLGMIPEPQPRRRTGSDIQAAAFVGFVPLERHPINARLGVQKTWHNGIPDRDLLVAGLTLLPHEILSINGTLWIDHYDSNDRIKSGTELTQSSLSMSLRLGPNHGLRLSHSFFRIPELRSSDFLPTSDTKVLDFQTNRVGASSWHRFGRYVQLDLRADVWQGDQANGRSGEAAVSLRDLPWDGLQFRFSAFQSVTDTYQSSGPRVSLRQNYRYGSVEIFGRVTRYTYRVDTSSETNSVIGSRLRFRLPWGVSLSLRAELRRSGGRDIQELGFFLQKAIW